MQNRIGLDLNISCLMCFVFLFLCISFTEAANPNVEALLTRGYEKLTSDLNVDAIIFFDQVIEIDHNNVDALNGRGRAKARMDKNGAAIEDFNRAIELAPANYRSYFYRGGTYYKSKHYDLALADLNKSIELNMNFGEAYALRGCIYRDKKMYQMAIFDYSKAIELNSANPLNYFNRANCYQALKNYTSAVVDYTRYISSVPTNSNAYYNRALCLIKLQNNQLALEDLTKAISLDPDASQDYYIQRGGIYFSSHDYKSSILDYENAVRIYPNSLGARVYGAMAYSHEKQIDKALKSINELIEMKRDAPVWYAMRAWVYAYNDKVNAAINDLLLTVELANKKKDQTTIAFAYMSLSAVHYRMKKYAHASSYYRAACDIEPIYRKPYELWLRETESANNIALSLLVDFAIKAGNPEILAQVSKAYASPQMQSVGRTSLKDKQFSYDQLDKICPDWERTNEDPIFLKWLSTMDMASGQTKRQRLFEAYHLNDTKAACRIFKEFTNSRSSE